MRLFLALGGLLAIASCASTPTSTSTATATSASASTSTSTSTSSSPLPFVDDDYPRALAEARSSGRLLFIDAWAPWCHTCLSMRAFTFRDPKVRAHAGDFVWASIDTENPKNAAWVDAHTMHVWPTLFIVDPTTGASVVEWPNSATADELVQILDRARLASSRDAKSGDPLDVEARTASTEAANGKRDAAITAWRDALARAPAAWPARASVVESLLDALYADKQDSACVETADRELPKVTSGGARAATFALMCASRLPASETKRPIVDREIERAHAMAIDAREPMLPDDRSGLYEVIVDALKDDGREAPAKDAARAWAGYLDAEAGRAADPQARAVFDAHRTDAYLELGEPEHAIPFLELSARDFPGDYNVHARLARAYLAAKRLGDASASIDRAAALVYGPRAMRVLSIAADIRLAQGDRAGAIAALKDALARAAKGPIPPRYVPVRAELERRLATLQAAP